MEKNKKSDQIQRISFDSGLLGNKVYLHFLILC